jgi:hypothetical protein
MERNHKATKLAVRAHRSLGSYRKTKINNKLLSLILNDASLVKGKVAMGMFGLPEEILRRIFFYLNDSVPDKLVLRRVCKFGKQRVRELLDRIDIDTTLKEGKVFNSITFYRISFFTALTNLTIDCTMHVRLFSHSFVRLVLILTRQKVLHCNR